jgi:chromosome segregation ATPase|tara:strand:- start:86 stop:286 length:201 start_codon:yes stop_codon:yes gene_type:complete
MIRKNVSRGKKMSESERRIKALEEKVETMDMLMQSLRSELEKAQEDIEFFREAAERELIRSGLSDL